MDAKATLTFNYIGHESKEEAVNGRSVINVSLREEGQALDDFVVIGYQTIKKKDLPGSVTSINQQDLVSAPVANAAQAIQGKLAGVTKKRVRRPARPLCLSSRIGISILCGIFSLIV